MSKEPLSRTNRAIREKTEELLTRSRKEPGLVLKEMTEHLHELHLHQTRLEMENEELREVKREIEESRARFADLYDRAPVGYLSLDSQGLIFELNAFAAKLLEEEKESLVRKPLSLSLHAGFQDLFQLHLQTVLQSAAVHTCELLMKKGDGAIFNAQLESIAAWEDGEAVVRSVMTDISGRKRSEQEMKEGLELLREVIEGTSDAIYVKDSRGRYVLFNGAAEKATGLKAAEVIGKDDASLFPAEEARRTTEADRAVMADGKTATREETVITPGGERTYLSSRGPIRDGKGSVKGLFRIARDITGLKRTQKALVDSEKRLGAALRDMEKLNRDLQHRVEELDAVFNTAPMGIAISYDQQCLHIKGNPALAAMLGLGPEDNLSKTAPVGQRPHNFREMREGRELSPRELPMQLAAAKGINTTNAEMDLVRDDGRLVKLLVSAAPLLNEHVKPRGAVGTFLDISELKKTQENLVRAHRKITTILESITDAFVSFDRQWRFTYVNDTACQLLTRPREELLGKMALDAFPETFRRRFHTDLEQAVHNNTPVHFEDFFPLQNAWYECHCYPSHDGLSVYFRDITERKRAEEARKQYVAKLDTLLDVSRNVLSAVSFDDMLHRAADGAKALTGATLALSGLDDAQRYSPPGPAVSEAAWWMQGELFAPEPTVDSGAGENLSMPPVDGRRDHPAWRMVLEGRGEATGRPGMEQRTGTFEESTAAKAPVVGEFTLDDEAVLSRLAAVAALGLRHVEARNEVERLAEERTRELRKAYETLKLEMERRKKAEQQLRQSQKMEALGTMAAGIGHDFNNVLAAVIGFTELTYEGLPSESPDRHRLERVLEAGMRGRQLVNQMLTFSSQAEQQKRPLLVSNAVKEVMKLLRPSIPTTIDIKVSLRREPGPIIGDPIQIGQVVVNLCNNAAYAMKEKGGSLDVELDEFNAQGAGPADFKPGTYVRLTIRDAGTGISSEHLDKVFDPFFTTKNEEGAGLGLSVVHGIVEQTGGYITVASEPGSGTVFDVYFPITDESGQEEPAADDIIPTGHERVLFIDDEKPLCELGREMLERLGYRVTTETSSIAALKLFIADPGRFDVVVTDQTMPNLTGIELARQFIALRRDIPVVLLTGFSHLVDADAAKTAGIREFLLKPLTKREMARTVRKVLDEPRGISNRP